MTAKRVSWFFLGLIIIIALWRIYSINKERYDYHKRISEEPINAKISKIEYKGRGGYEYFYGNLSIWESTLIDERVQILNVGDSLAKDANSLKFNVYRKDADGTYELVKTIQGRIN